MSRSSSYYKPPKSYKARGVPSTRAIENFAKALGGPIGLGDLDRLWQAAGSPPIPATILSVMPPDATTGTAVTVNGNAFNAAKTVKVGGVSVPFTVVSNWALTFAMPTGPAGPITIEVTNVVSIPATISYTRGA